MINSHFPKIIYLEARHKLQKLLSPDLKTVLSMDNQEAHSSDDSPDTSFTTISEHNSLKELSSPSNVLSDFGALYSENVTAKLWRVAAAHYQNVPTIPASSTYIEERNGV